MRFGDPVVLGERPDSERWLMAN